MGASEPSIIPAGLQSNPSGHVDSNDEPKFWIPLRSREISGSVNASLKDGLTLQGISLFVDGQPVDHEKLEGPTFEARLENQQVRNIYTYTFSISCLSPGKHVIQARYLADDVWSQLSHPIRIQVLYPEPPEIVSIAGGNESPFGPTEFKQPVNIRSNVLKINLANVHDDDRVGIYMDGELVGKRDVDDSCCIELNLSRKFIVPGIHKISVRRFPVTAIVHCQAKCQSQSLSIITFTKNYLLSPGISLKSNTTSGHGQICSVSSDGEARKPASRFVLNVCNTRDAHCSMSGHPDDDLDFLNSSVDYAKQRFSEIENVHKQLKAQLAVAIKLEADLTFLVSQIQEIKNHLSFVRKLQTFDIRN